MTGVDDLFAETFTDVSPLPKVTCTTMTQYVTLAGIIMSHKLPGVSNFDAQGAAIAKEKLKNT